MTDMTKPNPARMYDYMLGGNHNLEVDRVAADRMLQLVPSARNGARLNRWFIATAVEQLHAHGLTHFIDLASGLPTQGHIHDLMPDAKIIYNDIDPVTVAYAQEILADNPNVMYLQSNLTDIDTIIASAETFFAGQQQVGVLIVGITYFIADHDLQRVFDRLYDWCASGSQIAMTWAVGGNLDQRSQAIMDMYAKMGQPIHLRSLAEIEKFFAKWRIVEPGMTLLDQRMGVASWKATEENAQSLGDGYCVIIEKP